MHVELSEDQSHAMDQIADWIRCGEPQVMTLGGYAGTGKSTLIHEILQSGRIGGRRVRARVCAFTGKAADVLRSKGVPATTIHRLIYQPFDVCTRTEKPWSDCDLCIKEREAQEILPLTEMQRMKCKEACETDVSFGLAPELDASLVIVDEASMVNQAIYEDLLTFDTQILFVGDHGQLEPIGNNPKLMAKPKIRLERIHRQAEGSPIIAFAHHVRRGYQPKTFSPEARVIRSRTAPAGIEDFDMVLCGLNRTRVAINAKIRRVRGHHDVLPDPGERVVCLRNDHDRGVFNGMLATVKEVGESDDGDGIFMTVVDDNGDLRPRLPIAPEQFGQEKTEDRISRRKTLWDYGYCLTVHKAQGSEWDRVCVLEWIHRDWSAERWRYTAATRAKSELVYCINPRRRYA